MYSSGVFNNPGFGSMASCTILPNRIRVHIGMAGRTHIPRFLKSQVKVTLSAVNQFMLTGKLKLGCIVIKFHFRFYHFPTVSIVTQFAIGRKIIAMWRLPQTG
jgi:hypothetical protein